MPSRLTLLILGLLAAGVGAGLLLYLSPWRGSAQASSIATGRDIAELEKLALDSCHCQRIGGKEAHEKCWAGYEHRVAAFSRETWATACAPISTTVDCIRTASGESCVVVDWGVDAVCNESEAHAVEQAWSDAFDGVDPDDQVAWRNANDKASATMAAIVERLRRGEKVSARPGGGGCA